MVYAELDFHTEKVASGNWHNSTYLITAIPFLNWNISQNKEMFKPKTGHEADEGDEADNFRAVLNFLTLVVTMSKFMMVKIIKSLKVILKMLKLEKRQSFR